MFFTSRNRKLIENVERLRTLEQSIKELNQENKELLGIIDGREKAIQKIISEKSLGFPWLANAIAEFYRFPDIEIDNYLMTKKHPAYSSAEALREISAEKSVLRKQLKIAQNFVNYYETLFPWLTEYVGENLDELLESVKIGKQESNSETDPVLKYIPYAEYEKLSTMERNQKALDRYLSSRKKPYEIGRDYERFIGYSYEVDGFKVEYTGIEKGLEDLGRDLVCSKGDEIGQCTEK